MKRRNLNRFFLDGADEGDDDKEGSTMLETKMLEAKILEAKIENQSFAFVPGRIRPRSVNKSKVGKRELGQRESGQLNSSSLSMTALPSRSDKVCVATNDKDHSRLAMQAAKRMKSSKDKLRTGRLVCLHLRSLLTAAQFPEALPQRPVGTQSIENRQYPLPM
ncbi:MAG TPA: hypothetical protein DCE20_01095 [Gammaproteobacteria bacterium]|nr:hypothetical protein [Gammaproteobacteria bacterium]